jgi:hypothetical protein
VWAIRRDELKAQSDYFEFHVPRAHVGHLRAQEGLFTCALTPERHYRVNGVWPRLECAGLKKLTLPYSEVDELRRLLFAERYSEAHLMPGLDSIGNALMENWERQKKRFMTAIVKND